MYMLFNVERFEDGIRIIKQSAAELCNISLYIDHYYVGSMASLNDLTLKLPFSYANSIYIKADVLSNGYIYSLTEKHPITHSNNQYL
ncbi:hypothetical protein [Bacillus sp. PS06]|uniref:hypothetical protein n=1 Tax=Bacillus sp. PS06 TaxID=2764176 RepID=UPI00177C892E|nr:hypothetical protein [Bacillus sp. PS06]MBD8068525.1 hypothetical protein [Bacillus sp. PS06]